MVEGPMVTPGAGNDLHGVLKAKLLLSRPGHGLRVESRCSQTQYGGCICEVLGGDLGAHHEQGTLALTPVEAVEAVGKGVHCA